MKICLLLQRNFATLGNELASALKEQYGIDQFCAYVGSTNPYLFLQKQTEVKYTSLLLDEEIHERFKEEKLDLAYLDWLENEYGIPTLWPYINVDRVIRFNQLVRAYPYDKPRYTHEEMLRMVQVAAKAIIAFLDREKPDVFFGTVVGNIGARLLYEIARKKGVRVAVLNPCLFENRYMLGEEYLKIDQKILEGLPGVNSAEYKAAERMIGQFRARPAPYHPSLSPKVTTIGRRKQFAFLKPTKVWNSIKALASEIAKAFRSPEKNDYSYIPFRYYLWDRLLRKLRNLRGVNDLYSLPVAGENFAYFPLQMEPEYSLMYPAPFYRDQIAVVKAVAESLPVGYKLYVKEHPVMVEFRPRSYYKDLLKIPNVRIINPSVIGFDLIKSSKLVITITGSSALEAAFLKKPSICFSDIFYSNLSFIKRCRSLEELPHLVKEQIENFNYNEEELLRLMAGMIKNSSIIDIIQLWERESDPNKKKAGAKELASLVADHFGLKPVES